MESKPENSRTGFVFVKGPTLVNLMLTTSWLYAELSSDPAKRLYSRLARRNLDASPVFQNMEDTITTRVSTFVKYQRYVLCYSRSGTAHLNRCDRAVCKVKCYM